MELIVALGITVSGFSFLTYLYLSHISRLERLIKAENLVDVKHYETAKGIDESHTTLEDATPESLMELFDGKSGEEIIESFKRPYVRN